MISPLNKRSVAIGRGIAAALLAVAAVATTFSPAQAEIDDTNWSLRISEREMAFRPATDMMAMKSLMWDLPHSRMYARSMPFICLTNESATASITQFKMTIGDEQFTFGSSIMGEYAILGKESPTIHDLTSLLENNGNTLVVNFLNGGLLPGESINFKIDLDVDPGLSFHSNPDYRTVLFDMNGDNHYSLAGLEHDPSSDDNSEVTIKFEQSGQSPKTVGPTAFPDPTVSDGSAAFVNNNLARYGQNDPVRSFNLEGSGGTIPEPGSVALASIALVGMYLVRVRR